MANIRQVLLARIKQLRKQQADITNELDALNTAWNALAGKTGRAVKSVKRGRRRAMSAAQRKAVSARMKKYWAARRKANA